MRTENHKDHKIQYREASIRQLHIHCTNCDNEISSDNININNSLAKCDHCNSIFKIQEDDFFVEKESISKTLTDVSTKQKRLKPELMMPKGTDVLRIDDSLDIRVDNFRARSKGMIYGLTVFAALWNGFVATFLYNGGFIVALPLIIHLAVGLGLIAYLLPIYINYTSIVVTPNGLKISQYPLPQIFGHNSLFIDSKHINQLYVKKYVDGKVNEKPVYSYALCAELDNKAEHLTLIQGMNRDTQLYIEQEVEKHLNINDSFVKGVPNQQ